MDPSQEKPVWRNPWAWIPTLYFTQGIPYVIVMFVTVVMYNRLGVSNTEIALYTSWLYLPWVIKPLWSPVVDLLRTKRWWIITMQLVIGAAMAGVAFTTPLPGFLQLTLAFFWLMAFSSATHDIAADGLYMLGLSKHDQAWFVGVRSTFYRIAMISGQGLLVILAGYIESVTGLDDVEIRVRSNPDISVAEISHPADISVDTEDGAIRIVAHPGELEISTDRRLRSEVDSIIAFAQEWNLSQGFNPALELDLAGEEAEAETGPGWFRRMILSPVEEFITSRFGPEEIVPDTEYTGNIGVVYFYLSGPPDPGEEIVMNFGRVRGDNSISLVEGSYFRFTDENWHVPGMAVIRLDDQLDFASSAYFQVRSGNIPLAWSITFFFLAGMFVVFFLYHRFMLPYPATDRPAPRDPDKGIFSDFIRTFVLFFRKDRIVAILAFLLLYRFAEAQIVRLASPFLLDPQEIGGLALTTGQLGLAYGTVGLLALTIGGILGGIMAARHGLKFWLWPMVFAMNIPNLVYVYLSQMLPDSLLVISSAIALEQFGYGFGFTAYMLFMIYVSEGEHKTSHFAITTGFMALGMMVPGMFSGWIQEMIGYPNFFIWVMIATIPAFIAAYFIPLDKDFGKKENESHAESREGTRK
jgi:MFS transporter, PAT family, beta-lactamase induction signal transducer AmpG